MVPLDGSGRETAPSTFASDNTAHLMPWLALQEAKLASGRVAVVAMVVRVFSAARTRRADPFGHGGPRRHGSPLVIRPIAPPFVMAPPSGARVCRRLRVSPEDAAVLTALGRHLGSRVGADLARRCRENELDPMGRAGSWREPKRALAAAPSSRWAGAITRSTEDVWQLGWRSLLAARRSLEARVRAIRQRLAQPVGDGRGKGRGDPSSAGRCEKRRRLPVLEARLADVDGRLEEGHVPVCPGGGQLARARHHLDVAGLTEAAWPDRREGERLLITADGEAGQLLGSLTIRWHPDERWCELRLPRPLGALASRPGGRYRLTCPVACS